MGNQTYEVLIEGTSKKSKLHYYGRTTHNNVCSCIRKDIMYQKPANMLNVKIS